MTVLTGLALARGGLDRSGSERGADLLERLRADPATAVLQLRGTSAPVTGDPPALFLVPPEREGDRQPETWIFLGRDEDGRAFCAELCEPDAGDEAGGVRWVSLREVGALLGDRDATLLTTAVALAAWHAAHRRCPRCGAPTRVTDSGWTRTCDADGSQHFPRTDPAVIMSVVDDRDRILLGHQAAWPPGRFSTLAGFVEPGESLEAAVRREVAEEVGLTVDAVEYRGSQPWPFPASLMVGFRAHATGTQVVEDGAEISQARWFTREELAAEVARGEVLLPPAVSIARRLIEDWFGGALPTEGAWR